MVEVVKSQVLFGVPNTDIVLRTAIIAALDDVRAQPWVLDFFLQSLLHDELTRKYYGEKELQEVKGWVLNNEIVVTMAHHLNNVKQPHVSIEIADEQEIQQVLGDRHVVPSEKLAFVTKTPPALVFTPAAYDQATGIITLRTGQTTANVFPGQRVLDRSANAAYLIEEVLDGQDFRITAGAQLNLSRAEVVAADDLWTVQCESVMQAETYNVDCIIQGDPTMTAVLHSLIKFLLYRYKQALLEGRGFENTIIRSSGLSFSSLYGKEATQLLWKRAATITGWSCLYWPKELRPPIQGLRVGILIPTTTGEPSGADDAGWDTVLEADTLGQG